MMTTVQLFHRLGRRARTGDFTKLSASEQSDIMEAANSGLQEVYNLLPAYFKELTEGFLLPAPQTVSISIAQYAQTFSPAAFTAAQIGQSVVLPGDPGWNQVLGPGQLRSPYMGPSGTVQATLYGDAVYSTRIPFERIIGNPRFSDGSQGLMNVELAHANNVGNPVWPWQQTVGRPVYWWTQMIGNSQGNTPLLVLKFSPAPDQAYAISVRSSYWPVLLQQSDYDNATVIPVPDQFVNRCLIPIALEALMGTPVWEKTPDDPNVINRAAEARLFAKNQLGLPASPSNRISTPIGY